MRKLRNVHYLGYINSISLTKKNENSGILAIAQKKKKDILEDFFWTLSSLTLFCEGKSYMFGTTKEGETSKTSKLCLFNVKIASGFSMVLKLKQIITLGFHTRLCSQGRR